MTRLKLLLAYLVLAALVWVAVWAASMRRLKGGEPGRFVDRQLALAETGQDAEAANAWPELTRAVKTYGSVAESRRRGGKSGFTVDRWDRAWAETASAEELDRLRGDVAACDRAGLATMLDGVAAGRRFLRPLDPGRALMAPMPEAADLPGLAAYTRARMALALKDGDGERFTRSLRHSLALTHALRVQAAQDATLSSIAMDRRLGWALHGLAGSMEPGVLREALEALRTSYRAPDLAAAVRGQSLCDLDVVEWCYSADGRLVPAAAAWMVEEDGPQRTPAGSLAKLRLFWGPSKEETLAALASVHEAAVAEASLPLRERLDAAPGRCEAVIAATPERQIFVHALGPMMARFLRTADAGDLEIAGAKVMLAVELHRKVHGAYPASLAEMDPPLRSLDLRAEWAREFVYRVGGAAGYTLYWIGRDGQDDGGATPATGGRVSPFLPESRGLDYVFTPLER